MLGPLILLLLQSFFGWSSGYGHSGCSSRIFANLTVFGTEVLSVSATPYTNISGPFFGVNAYPIVVTGLNVCEVIVQYTHPRQNDTINVYVWLPEYNTWNGRLMGVGGGGWSTAGENASLIWAASQGFSAVTTDGGHSGSAITDPASWGLVSPGNVNFALLNDFASIALDDAASFGKLVSASYYGSRPKYAYWNGCSTGGRQGHMLAQRYPQQYNGILATASAFNWATFVPSEFWPAIVMNEIGDAPRSCELEYITEAAIAACDGLDGVTDNIISYPGLCQFDPQSVVGQTFNCSETGTNVSVSATAATVAAATWQGPRTVDGRFIWYGLDPGAPLNGLANTNCTNPDGSDTGDCRPAPFPIAADWIRVFVVRDPEFDPLTLTHRQYDSVMRQSHNRYDSIIGAYDPDLTDFRDAGGKLITWHGLSDQLIPPNGTAHYFERVLELDPNATDYYRYFEAPGVEHCALGLGWFPGDAVNSLIDWVEGGIAPETLLARTVPEFTGNDTVREVNLCLYPERITYVGGDINSASSFTCQ